MQIVLHAHHLISRLHLDELEVHRRVLGASSVNGHAQHLLLHNFPEPFLVRILLRTHIYPYDHRTGELRLKSENASAGIADLQSEVVEVHPVVHILGADGYDFDGIQFVVVRGPDAEHRRGEYGFPQTLGIEFRGVDKHFRLVVVYIGLDSVHSGDALQFGFESH